MRRRPVVAAPPAHSMISAIGCASYSRRKPSFAIAGSRVGRIQKHAAADQDAKRFRHQRADPAHVEIRVAIAVGAGKALVDIGADRSVPVPAIGGVDGEFRRVGRDLDALRDQQEFRDYADRE